MDENSDDGDCLSSDLSLASLIHLAVEIERNMLL